MKLIAGLCEADLQFVSAADQHPDGTSEFEPFLAENLEVGFRYNCIVGSSMRDERLRDVMARSWAAVMLGSHPEAARVLVVAQSFELPAMQAFAAGQRPSWKLVYAGKFDRRQRAPGVPGVPGVPEREP